MPSAQEQQGITISDLASCMLRHRKLALAAAFAVAVFTLLVTLRMTPLYEAEATLAVEPRSKGFDFQVDPTTGGIEFSFLNTIRDKLSARQVIEAALGNSGLLHLAPYTDHPNPTALATSRLSVKTSRDSLSLKVFFRDEQPERGEKMLEALLLAFPDAQITAHSTRSNESLSFLARSKQETERQLAELQNRERTMRQEYDLVDDSPSDNIHAQRMRRLTDQLAALTKSNAAAK
ncbi:MAG: Wzz/FepE/Etk N-terminal domain-containing protein, partial [Planctomycetota bacterium]|nr:Wzz/FepE/Etk N-terminal domain-containing protein [Planctomycetota bacterium]